MVIPDLPTDLFIIIYRTEHTQRLQYRITRGVFFPLFNLRPKRVNSAHVNHPDKSRVNFFHTDRK